MPRLRGGCWWFFSNTNGKRPDTNNKHPVVDNGERLVLAADAGDLEEVKRLLACGIDPDFKSEGETALFVESKNGHSAIVKVLLAGGAQVDTKCRTALKSEAVSNATALIAAIYNGNIELIQLLI